MIEYSLSTNEASNSNLLLRKNPKNTCGAHDPNLAEFRQNQTPIISTPDANDRLSVESVVPVYILTPYIWDYD